MDTGCDKPVGTLTTAAGAPLKESMARLGHIAVTASLTYQHIAAGRDAEITANHVRG